MRIRFFSCVQQMRYLVIPEAKEEQLRFGSFWLVQIIRWTYFHFPVEMVIDRWQADWDLCSDYVLGLYKSVDITVSVYLILLFAEADIAAACYMWIPDEDLETL